MEENMGRTLAEMMRNVPPERRKKIERRAAELIADEMSLRELRRAMGRTQTKVAKDSALAKRLCLASKAAPTC